MPSVDKDKNLTLDELIGRAIEELGIARSGDEYDKIQSLDNAYAYVRFACNVMNRKHGLPLIKAPSRENP